MADPVKIDITVTSIEDQDDGSAIVNFVSSLEASRLLMGKGLFYLSMVAAYGLTEEEAAAAMEAAWKAKQEAKP